MIITMPDYYHADPVFYCNVTECDAAPGNVLVTSGVRLGSVKEAVKFASENNLIGLMCSSSLLVGCLRIYTYGYLTNSGHGASFGSKC